MKKILSGIILTMCIMYIYSCKKDGTVTPITDPADSFVGTWNAVDTSYYFGVKTDFYNYNFTVYKTDSNKVTLIGFPHGEDSSHGTVTSSTIEIAEDSTVIQVINSDTWTYRQELSLFEDYYILGKATKF